MPTNADLPLEGVLPRLSFTGHQTFAFRYAWLPKGVNAVKTNDAIFFEDDALVELGVGKNMVDSIRFWCEALDLIEVNGVARKGALTPLGELLFGRDRRSNGKDPYLEDPGTLWLLQWQLASRPEVASTWHLAFTRWGRAIFTRDQLVRWILRIAVASTASRSSEGSIKRDVDVFLRTYLPAEQDRRRPIEDSFDCPLAELGLIRQLDDGYFQFNVGSKLSLPVEVLAYTIAQFWSEVAPNQEVINIERLLYDPGSPGGAFKLNDKALVPMLEQLPKEAGMRYDETAGLRQLTREKKGAVRPFDLLQNYYAGA